MNILGRNIRVNRQTLVGIIFSVILLLSYGAYRQFFVFHMTSIDPSLSSVSTISPNITLAFNMPLDKASFRMEDPAGIVTSPSIDGKVLTLGFDNELSADKTYKITLRHIESKSGKVLESRILVFTAKDIEYSKLSGKQKQTLINKQDKYPYEVDYVAFNGFDALLDNGMSAAQLDSVKQAIFDYSEKIKKEYWQVDLVQKSLSIQIHERDSADSIDTQTFTITASKTTLKVTARYDVVSNSVIVQIYDTNGVLVYDTSADPSD